MLNERKLTNSLGYSSDKVLYDTVKADITSSLNEMYKLQNDINLSKLKVSDRHELILDEKTIPLNFK